MPRPVGQERRLAEPGLGDDQREAAGRRAVEPGVQPLAGQGVDVSAVFSTAIDRCLNVKRIRTPIGRSIRTIRLM